MTVCFKMFVNDNLNIINHQVLYVSHVDLLLCGAILNTMSLGVSVCLSVCVCLCVYMYV